MDVVHGSRHAPRGSDPARTDEWRYVGGAEDGDPPYISGANAPASTAVPNPMPLRFRLAVGPPNICDYAGWEPADPTSPPDPTTTARPVASAILEYTDHQIEIQGDVTDVSSGDIVFIMPLEYRHDFDVPCHAHDDSGNYVPCRLLSTGEFIYGVP